MRIEELDYNRIGTLLTDWFAENARILPWRTSVTPYHVWISEIMLQQTRVEAVKAYYRRFLAVLPDVESLAACGEDTYLKLWEGLGYYSRVRNLHKAAQQIMAEYGGVIPSDPSELKKLAGIGDYTAGAIGSIAFGKPVSAVDGNVLRVFTRLAADPSDIADPRTKKRMQAAVDGFLAERMHGTDPRQTCPAHFTPGSFNQSIMDLGATICLPNGEPKCGICPVAECCRGLAEGRETDFPVKAAKKPRRIEEKTVLILREGERVALHRRPKDGLLADLWEFPNLPGHLTCPEAADFVRSLGYEVLRADPLPDAKHIFTHVEWRMTAFSLQLAEMKAASQAQQNSRAQAEFVFVDPAALRRTYAVPSAFRAYNHF